MRNITKLIIHCSATAPTQFFNAADIRKWHIDKGWSDIGYHRVITRLGVAENGRPIEKDGAHAKGYNHDSIGVCLVGGVNIKNEPEFNFTHSQMQTLKWVVDDYVEMFGPLIVMGHRDLPGVDKACPSFDVRAWWDQ